MERIAQFSHRAEADLARAALEAEGVRALVMADDAGGTYPGLPVYLFVEPGDADLARSILEPNWPSEPQEPPPLDPTTENLLYVAPKWAIAGLVLAVLFSLAMIVLTLTH